MPSSCCLSTHNARIIMSRVEQEQEQELEKMGGRAVGSGAGAALNRFDLSNTPIPHFLHPVPPGSPPKDFDPFPWFAFCHSK